MNILIGPRTQIIITIYLNENKTMFHAIYSIDQPEIDCRVGKRTAMNK